MKRKIWFCNSIIELWSGTTFSRGNGNEPRLWSLCETDPHSLYTWCCEGRRRKPISYPLLISLDHIAFFPVCFRSWVQKSRTFLSIWFTAESVWRGERNNVDPYCLGIPKNTERKKVEWSFNWLLDSLHYFGWIHAIIWLIAWFAPLFWMNSRDHLIDCLIRSTILDEFTRSFDWLLDSLHYFGWIHAIIWLIAWFAPLFWMNSRDHLIDCLIRSTILDEFTRSFDWLLDSLHYFGWIHAGWKHYNWLMDGLFLVALKFLHTVHAVV